MKKFVWIFIIIIIGAAVFIFWKKNQDKKKVAPPIKSPQPAPLKAAKDEPEEEKEFPLKKDSRGEKVRILQKMLNSKFGASLTPNGLFDNATEAALMKAGFQKQVDEKDFYLIQSMSLAAAHKLKMKK